MRLRLTPSETKKLDEVGSVYALRESGAYLVEKMTNKYMVTIFCSNVEVIKNYQTEIEL